MPAVPYIDLGAQHRPIKDEILAAVERVLDHGQFILGDEVAQFEERFAAYCGARYAIGVGNGTDALVLAMKALGVGPGDEVITAVNSFLASASSIALSGATPVLADVGDDYNIDPLSIERAITTRTRAIMPVHLTGNPADMEAIGEIADRHNLVVIEDAAQAIGASFGGNKVGPIGDAGTFSFHPLKNLNACGDGGAIVTNNEELRDAVVHSRNHGLVNRDLSREWSPNSRLDALQAAILTVKLEYLDAVNAQRRANADRYRAGLENVVALPNENPGGTAVYHTFVVQVDQRDRLIAYLGERGIGSAIHYPTPIHLQPAAEALGYSAGDFPVAESQAGRILSLPVHQELSDDQIDAVIDAIGEFYGPGGSNEQGGAAI